MNPFFVCFFFILGPYSEGPLSILLFLHIIGHSRENTNIWTHLKIHFLLWLHTHYRILHHTHYIKEHPSTSSGQRRKKGLSQHPWAKNLEVLCISFLSQKRLFAMQKFLFHCILGHFFSFWPLCDQLFWTKNKTKQKQKTKQKTKQNKTKQKTHQGENSWQIPKT